MTQDNFPNASDLASQSWCHLCIDVQRMFDEDTPWHVDWMNRVLPQIEEVVARHAERTIFTRFVPPVDAAEAPGAWRAYYEKWEVMTRRHLAAELIDVVPALQRFVPPARVFDKPTYSPWTDGRLHVLLQRQATTTVVLSGGETDVCVLAAALAAIDLGYRVVLLSDAICSGADETHDAALKLLGDRYSVQLEIRSTEEFLQAVSIAA